MIVVTGATGQLGSRIVDRLLDRVPAETLAVSVRDTDRAASLAQRGVRVRAADFTEPATLERAFEAADRVLVISTAIRGSGAVAANCAAIDAARAAGATRILYTSHQAAAKDSLFSPAVTHAETEEHLARQGVAFTALRNGFYASTLGYHLGAAVESGELALPQDGPFSWTGHDDLADAAVAAILDDGAGGDLLDGVTPPLTAPEMLDFDGVASILSELTGRTVTRVVVGDEDWKDAAVRRGMPPQAADFTLGMFRAARRGEFAVTHPALQTVIGRRPVPARAVLGTAAVRV